MSDINYEAHPEYARYGNWEDLAAAQKKEIERLRRENEQLRNPGVWPRSAIEERAELINENTRLRISVADFKQCAEAAHRATDERDAEIERLREENSTLSDSLATKADRIDRLGETVVRLLGLLRELYAATDEFWIADELLRRIREAIGDAPDQRD